MGMTKSFITAWRAWHLADEPIANSRQRRFNAPTYEIEVALDHVASYVYGLGLYAIEGKNLDYGKLALEELLELDKVVVELERCEAADREKEELMQYIVLTGLIYEHGNLRNLEVQDGEYVLEAETNAIQEEGPFKGKRIFEEDNFDDNIMKILLQTSSTPPFESVVG